MVGWLGRREFKIELDSNMHLLYSQSDLIDRRINLLRSAFVPQLTKSRLGAKTFKDKEAIESAFSLIKDNGELLKNSKELLTQNVQKDAINELIRTCQQRDIDIWHLVELIKENQIPSYLAAFYDKFEYLLENAVDLDKVESFNVTSTVSVAEDACVISCLNAVINNCVTICLYHKVYLNSISRIMLKISDSKDTNDIVGVEVETPEAALDLCIQAFQNLNIHILKSSREVNIKELKRRYGSVYSEGSRVIVLLDFDKWGDNITRKDGMVVIKPEFLEKLYVDVRTALGKMTAKIEMKLRKKEETVRILTDKVLIEYTIGD